MRSSAVKRLIDISFAAVGIALTAPLWLAVGLAVKMQDAGPVFYGQDRVGRGGTRFRSWKFRSMIAGSDVHFGPLQASDHDTRVTKVGRLLRATALDELPQLWNILRGDMSFVGPRPLMLEEIEINGKGERVPIDHIPGYYERHAVRPGLTGLAQVYAPRDVPRRHKFKYDRLYIRRQNFGLDVSLLLLSLWISLRGKWERRGAKI